MNQEPEKIYTYRNEQGAVVYEKLRYYGKRFIQRRPDGKGGYTANLEGVARVPYRLPELVKALALSPDAPVILTEGEKDCDSVRKLGFSAVSSFKDWKPEFNRYISGRDVVLLADKDVAGWRIAGEAAAVIFPAAQTLKVVDLFPRVELKDSKGFDVTNWIEELTRYGGSNDEGIDGDLRDEIRKATPWHPAAELKTEPEKAADAAFFRRRTAGETLRDAACKPRAKHLFDEFWFEGELCILFADTNVGKSILSVQLCEAIASGVPIGAFRMETPPQKVVYFDFELSERQFLARYAIEDGEYYRDTYPFDPNLERVEIDPNCDIPGGISFEDLLYAHFQAEVLASNAKIVVVDNITFLRTDNEKARHAAPLMRQLKRLKEQLGLSMLIMAHTPKRSPFNPITLNDLQGSKMLMNFTDSAFAIGASSREIGVRYLKQIKTRNGSGIFHAGNVPLAKIEKRVNFLQFEFEGFGKEKDHLLDSEDEDRRKLFQNAKELRSRGKSYREIGETLGISLKQAERLLKRGEEE